MRMSKLGAARFFDMTRNMERFSLRDSLTLVRWMARATINARTDYQQLFARSIRKAKSALPLNSDRVATLEAQATKLRASQNRQAEHICNAVKALDRDLTKSMDFETICELLAVNPVHRAVALEQFTPGRGAITTIAFIAGVENSAQIYSGRRADDAIRSPLFEVLMAGIYKVIRENPDFMIGVADSDIWEQRQMSPSATKQPAAAFHTRMANGSMVASVGRAPTRHRKATKH